jgi:hypothetical protein
MLAFHKNLLIQKNYESGVMSYELWIMSDGSWVVDYGRLVIGYEILTTFVDS